MVLAQPTFHPFKDFLYFCNQEGVITQLLSSALPIFCAQRGNNPSKRVTHFSRYGKMHFKVLFFLQKFVLCRKMSILLLTLLCVPIPKVPLICCISSFLDTRFVVCLKSLLLPFLRCVARKE